MVITDGSQGERGLFLQQGRGAETRALPSVLKKRLTRVKDFQNEATI